MKFILKTKKKGVLAEPVIIKKYYDGIEVKSVASPEHAQKVAIEQYHSYSAKTGKWRNLNARDGISINGSH